jgi:hypothetical protein
MGGKPDRTRTTTHSPLTVRTSASMGQYSSVHIRSLICYGELGNSVSRLFSANLRPPPARVNSFLSLDDSNVWVLAGCCCKTEHRISVVFATHPCDHPPSPIIPAFNFTSVVSCITQLAACRWLKSIQASSSVCCSYCDLCRKKTGTKTVWKRNAVGPSPPNASYRFRSVWCSPGFSRAHCHPFHFAFITLYLADSKRTLTIRRSPLSIP